MTATTTSTATRKPMQTMTLTDAAAARIRYLIEKRGEPTAGLRIGVKNAGCSGHTYTLDFVAEKAPFDEVVEEKGVTVMIDGKALMFLLGTEMDYVEEKLRAGFVFNNPNETARCGCGESFSV